MLQLPLASALGLRRGRTGVPTPIGAWIATVIGDPVLKKPTVALRSLRRLIGIESEIIQCAPANRVGVLILSEGLQFQVIELEVWVTVHGRAAETRVV